MWKMMPGLFRKFFRRKKEVSGNGVLSKIFNYLYKFRASSIALKRKSNKRWISAVFLSRKMPGRFLPGACLVTPVKMLPIWLFVRKSHIGSVCSSSGDFSANCDKMLPSGKAAARPCFPGEDEIGMNQMTGYSRIFGGKLQIDGGALKMIAVVTMFIDHLTLCFLEVVKGPDGRAILYSIPYGKVLDRIGRGIGRTAFPIFCFMVVEALIYTRSRVSYLVRMLLFAAISHYPFNWMIFSGSEKIHCSVMATLALGFLAVWIMDAMAGACLGRQYTIRAYKGLDPVPEEERGQPVGSCGLYGNRFVNIAVFGIVSVSSCAGFCGLAAAAHTDYRYGGVLLVVIFYLLYRIRDLSLAAGWAWISYYNESELLAFPGFLLLKCYNGKKGMQNKYFFYIFYPAHLLLLYLVRRALFGA